MEYKCLRLVWGCGLNVLDAMFDSICFKIKFVRWQSAANNTTTNKQARLWQTLCVFPSWAFLRPKCSKTLSECWYLICVGQWLWYKQDNPFQRVCKMLFRALCFALGGSVLPIMYYLLHVSQLETDNNDDKIAATLSSLLTHLLNTVWNPSYVTFYNDDVQ